MRLGAAASFAVATSVLIACWGCGSESGPHVAPTVPVKGKISYNGKPLTKGTIRFEPTDIGREAHGTIKSDGTFELSTFKEGDGAVPGVHRVTVSGTTQTRSRTRNSDSAKAEVEVSEGKTEYVVDLK